MRLRSAAVMRGYWGGPPTGPGAAGLVLDRPATDAVLADDGWLTTGDFGYLDDDGRLHLVGRANELYIRGGYNVYPAEVEGALGDYPGIEQVAVVGLPDPVLGEVGVAFVVPADGVGPDPASCWPAPGGRPGDAGRLQGAGPGGGPGPSPPDVDDEGRQEGPGRPGRPGARTELTAAMTGNSTPASGGVTDDPIRIGTMLYTLVEPHRGHEVDYNRWYERDHFYAGCQIGAYNFSGARFVSTAPLKGLRYPTGDGALVADPRSAPTSACTTCSTATTTSGTGGRSTRSTPCTPPAGCSRSATTSTPGSTGSSGSTVGTPTVFPPSSPSTTGSPGWCRSTSSRPPGRRAPVGAWCANTYLPGVPGSPVATSSGSARCRCWPTLRATSPVTTRWTTGCSCSASSTRTRRPASTPCSGRSARCRGGRRRPRPVGVAVPRHRARHRHLHRPAVGRPVATA